MNLYVHVCPFSHIEPEVPFASIAFVGPLVAGALRPVGGWLADKINSGTKVPL